VWAAAYEDYEEGVRHGHWMRASFASGHPTQLCDVNRMLACPPLWAAKPDQPKEKCQACLWVLADLLALALGRLGKTCGQLSPCGTMLCRKPPHEGDVVHIGPHPSDPESSLFWLDPEDSHA
jgi:hypothetical protein